MSNVDPKPTETLCGGTATVEPEWLLLEPREVPLGGPRAMLVRRTLPHKQIRTVGAWCFVDHYGPHDVARSGGMDVPPHPHTGLQTVTWLLDGEVLHRDSLGSEQLVRPGELNLMTAGHGIAHSEESTSAARTLLGVQLWLALPAAARDGAAAFAHHDDLPRLREGAATVTVLLGEVGGARSPAATFTPIVGADVTLDGGADVTLPLDAAYEHAVLAVSGEPVVDGRPVGTGTLVHLGLGRTHLPLSVPPGARARLMLVGGVPFEEQLVMWWNFVGRSHEEIAAARADWAAAADRFGTVPGYPGPRLPAPALPTTPLLPRGRRRA